MKNPCRECEHLGRDKNDPGCMRCEKRVAYVNSFGRAMDMGSMIGAQGIGPKAQGYKEGNMENQAEYGKTKVCNKPDCEHGGRPQPIENFAKHPECKDGRENQCRSCRNRMDKERALRKKAGAAPSAQVKAEAKIKAKTGQTKTKPVKAVRSAWIEPVEDIWVSIDFSEHMDIYERLSDAAKKDLRPVDMQALYILSQAFGR